MLVLALTQSHETVEVVCLFYGALRLPVRLLQKVLQRGLARESPMAVPAEIRLIQFAAHRNYVRKSYR